MKFFRCRCRRKSTSYEHFGTERTFSVAAVVAQYERTLKIQSVTDADLFRFSWSQSPHIPDE